eukprot:m.207801 g.207801  ORF g.207801 m.207801 type:complete len:344 (-) comp18943_c0_seq4:973-2004(-)
MHCSALQEHRDVAVYLTHECNMARDGGSTPVSHAKAGSGWSASNLDLAAVLISPVLRSQNLGTCHVNLGALSRALAAHVVSRCEAGVVLQNGCDNTCQLLRERDVQELVRAVGVGRRPQHTDDEELRTGKLLSEHPHKRDRAALPVVHGWLLVVCCRPLGGGGLEPRRQRRRVPAGARLVPGELDGGAVGCVRLEFLLDGSTRHGGVDRRRQTHAQHKLRRRSQHIPGIGNVRESPCARHRECWAPRAIQRQLREVRRVDRRGSRQERKVGVDLVAENGRCERSLLHACLCVHVKHAVRYTTRRAAPAVRAAQGVWCGYAVTAAAWTCPLTSCAQPVKRSGGV